jgi:putative peptidoglycan lipid II flippase
MKLVAKSSLIIAFFFGINKILGFVRQLFVARQFQLSYELDAFNAANNIPDLLAALLSGGALAIALIPVLTETLDKQGRKEAWQLFSNVLNLAFIVTALISVILLIVTPFFINNIVVPGFPQEYQQLSIEIMRLNLLAVMIFSISGLFMAGLQANRHFLFPAIAPAMYNIGQIFGVVILAPATGYTILGITLPAFGLGIHGLVYGVILGALLHLLIQVPALIMYRFHWEPKLRLRSAAIRKVLVILAPRVATMFFIQLFYIVRDNLASGMGEGAVTALNLGWFIMQVPEAMIGTALGIAILPSISSAIMGGREPEFIKSINAALRALFAITIPIAVLLSIGLFPLVELAFGYEPADTQRVVLASQVYLAGLVGHALLEIASRAFYAKQKPIIPLYAAILNALSYFLLALVLSNWFGFIGIAISNTVVFTAQAIIMLFILNRQHKGIFAVKKTIIKVTAWTAGSGLIVYLFLSQAGFLPAFLQSAIAVTASICLCWWLMRHEITPILDVQ